MGYLQFTNLRLTRIAATWFDSSGILIGEVDFGSKLWAIVLGIIFAIIAISLAIASWTRWGQSKPLTKCVALAVLAHVWLLMYAYGTRIIHPGNGEGPGDAGLANESPITFQMLASPAPPSLSDDASDAEAAVEPEPIVAPQWAKPLDLPLPMPELQTEEPTHDPVESLADVELNVPSELLEVGDEMQLPTRTSDDAQIVQNEQLIPKVESLVSDVQLPPLETAGTEDASSEQVVVPRESLTGELSQPQSSLVSLPRADLGMRAMDDAAPRAMKAAPSQTVTKDVYQLRFSPNRSQTIHQNGGDAKSEAAVAAALGYLARAQQRDGSWNAALYGAGRETGTLNENRYGTGGKADTAMTGLALLAFLGDGHTHLNGTYQANVIAGLEYLLASQMPSGDLSGPKQVGNLPDVRYAKMYSHGIALLAIAEAYAITSDDRLKDAVVRGCNYTLQAQNPITGGWRYDNRYTGDPGDLSQFGWQALAIQSCRRAGLQIPSQVTDKMQSFLDSVSVGPNRGLAVYRPIPNQTPTPAMTAEAFASRALLGRGWNAASQREATELLLTNLPGQSEENFYYFYYATLALFQQQGDAWLTWNAALKPHLVSTQKTSGAEAGSWDPTCIWGGYGGRIYSTAMGCMCLEIYYRYLPMYEF